MKTFSRVLLGGALLVACGDDADPASAVGNEGEPVDPMTEFVPGDPDFVRDEDLNVDNISKHDDRRSHTLSKNCLSCHQPNGPGKGLFTVAGTLRDENGEPYPNAILRFYAKAQAPGGGPVQWGGPVELTDELMEIEIDGNGNFYTTEALPDIYPDQPIYPQFFSEDGEPLYRADGKMHAIMGSGVQVGGCNFCHNEKFPIVGRDEPATE